MSDGANSIPRHEYQSFLDQTPADWEQKEIRQIGSVIGGGTPSREVPSFWRGTIPWVTPGEVSGNATKLLYDTDEHISSAGLAGSGANLVPAGSLLVTTRATLGARVINAVPMATNQGFKSIVFKAPEEAGYYFHLFEKVKPELVRRASGTTFLEISSAEFGTIKVPSPDLTEKQIIANILDTLDAAINQTNTIVTKLKAVKRGFLHDLLTRGIDESGELRPSQVDAPHLYKESPLGWIPKEWEVCALSQLGMGGLVNGVFKEPLRVGSGVPLVNVADLYRGESINLGECELFAATETERSRYDVHIGDIFFTRSSLKLEGIAQTSYVATEVESAVFECHVMRLRPNAEKVAARFLKEWCSGSYARKHFMAHSKQVTMTTISQDGICTLQCPKPPLDEQFEAVQRIGAIDARINSESTMADKLRATRQALMNDLLFGRIRVTSLVERAEQREWEGVV